MAPADPETPGLGDIIALRNEHLISIANAAGLLMISDERIYQLVRDGLIPKPLRKGLYPLTGVVQGYIKFLKDEQRTSTRVAADSGIKRARELEIMQRVRERSNQLIEGSVAAEALDDVVSVVVTELDGLPARFTRDVKVRKQLQVKIDEVRARIHAVLDEKVLALRAGESALPAESGDDA
ncbi:MAG: hypothetical protein JWM36_3203 [Hyphomicrobiales bacterium]|nr:hypothetical protein [Hyphomicrobiales bacterium]